jgi:cell wall-associated NlpC family hydrolase
MGLVRFASVILLTAVAAGCATSGAVPKPFPGAPTPEAPGSDTAGTPEAPEAPRAPARVPRPEASAIVQTALSFRGVPYRNGGSGPAGFDCSGLVQYVFAQHGIGLPREVRDQFRVGSDVRVAGVEPGDLVFFNTGAQGPSHVGLAIGGDQFVHAPSSRGVVRVERFSAPYWASRIIGIKRLTN